MLMRSVSSESFEGFEKRRFEKPEWYESDARYLARLCTERDKELVTSGSIHQRSNFAPSYYYTRFDEKGDRNTCGLLRSNSISVRSEIYVLSRQRYVWTAYKFTREEEKKGKTSVLRKFKKWMKHKDKAGKRSKENDLVFKSKTAQLGCCLKRLTCFAVRVEPHEDDFLQEHEKS